MAEERTLGDEYHSFIDKWIKIYIDLIGEDVQVTDEAKRVCSLVPFNFAKPQTVSAVCVYAAGTNLNRQIKVKDLINATGISMRGFIEIRKKLIKKGVICQH